jgi:adenine-specific DNA-methyltransferase
MTIERVDPAYLREQLITYIGNKRALLAPIEEAVEKVKAKLGKSKLLAFDAFAGSGVVSRLLKAHSRRLISNDLEDYAAVIGRCYLRNRGSVDWKEMKSIIDELNRKVTAKRPMGFFEELYSPQDETKITRKDRVFYTRDNARRLDGYRQLIDDAPPQYRDLLLGPLLSKASVHANTAGVFKGFYKDRRTGLGRFGGSNADALSRIRGIIELELPILSRFDCEVDVRQQDANALAKKLKNLDFAYIDPPYNQHPYGSNYFMLNLLVNYRKPEAISRVSGIPEDWRRSAYNVRSQSLSMMKDLIESFDASHILISFNNEGFIAPAEMQKLLKSLGKVEVFETRYNAFRGSRNLRNRDLYVTEQLFLLEKK